MKYHGAALVVAIVGAYPTAACAQEWYHLIDRLGYLYFADEGAIVRTGDAVDLVFLQGNLDGPPEGENVMLSYRIDCAGRTAQLMGGRIFMDDGVEVPDFTLPGGPGPVSIDTISPGEVFYDFACLGGYRQTPVEDPFAQIRASRAEM